MADRAEWYGVTGGNTPAVATTLENVRASVWALLQIMTGNFAALPGIDYGSSGAPASSLYATWIGSSDGVTGGMDGVNRLGATFDNSKWVRGTGVAARTWGVIKTAAGIYFGFHYDTASDSYFSVYASRVAPTGGSATASPVWTNSVTPGTSFYLGGPLTTSTRKVHATFSSDGDIYFALSTAGTHIPLMILISTVVDPFGDDPEAWILWSNFTTSDNSLAISTILSPASGKMRSMNSALQVDVALCAPMDYPNGYCYNSGSDGRGHTYFEPVTRLWQTSVQTYRGHLPDIGIAPDLANGVHYANPAAGDAFTHTKVARLWLPFRRSLIP